MTDNLQEQEHIETGAEELFVDIFQEAVGIEVVGNLAPQYPTRDIYDGTRYIDYALIGRNAKYAFEIDGEYWHRTDSPVVTTEQFRDDLLKQNSLVHLGWKVLRWSDGQLFEDRDTVKEQIRLFLEDDIVSNGFDGYLPQQDAEEFALHKHQQEALDWLSSLREGGKSIALLTHATGSGKTTTATIDARSLNMRTLYLVHRTNLVRQTLSKLREYWPEVECEAYSGGRRKPDSFVVVGTYQGVGKNLDIFGQDEFSYLIADEAHHVPAPTFTKTLGYFKPQFTLGMTATPDRMDNKSLLEIFRECAPRLGLKEAIERRLLVPVRCVRVKTNVDLTKVRFNGSDYRFHDLEEKLSVPERDSLIVSTYCDHVKDRPGVTFCINIAHSEHVAELFRQNGVASESVSGRMSNTERESVLGRYQSGELQMLCACDLLNEGWDSPRTEVLMMARPTLSRVLYVQQLGRGTRLYPGKDCLYVFDFIDNTTRYAQSLNVHRLFNTSQYRPGALVAAPVDVMEAEQSELDAGDIPIEIAHLGLYIDRMEDVDVFDWKTAVANMLTTAELEVELGIGGGTAVDWVRSGKLVPDHSIEMGSRMYNYFIKARIDDIRKQFGLKKRTAATRKQDFLEFISEMDMASSYKPVMLLALLDSVDDDGRCMISELALRFRQFYLERAESGLPVELGRNQMKRAAELSDADVTQVLLQMPFEKFERRKFLRRDKDVAWVYFDKTLWKSLDTDDKLRIRQMAGEAIEQYYQRGGKIDA